MNEDAVYRILDAAANRAAEGLRTIEEWVRFGMDDAKLSKQLKEFRHELTAATSQLDRRRLLTCRDTEHDCGTQISTPSELQRGSAEQVVAAAFSRVQQSLRCLEEYGKLVSITFAQRCERLRYQSYSLEKKLLIGAGRNTWIERARLYVLVDLDGDQASWLKRIERLVNSGVDVIQIRDKRADDRTLYQRSLALMDWFRSQRKKMDGACGCLLIINDRADIAAAVGADGVHVGQEELPIEAVRKVIGNDKLVGLSTHSIEQVVEAVEDGADYIGCGPTFPSGTKAFDAFVGVALTAEATRQVDIPAFAIGGINETNLNQLMEAGVSRVVVGGAIWGRGDEPEAAARMAARIATRLDVQRTL